VSGLQPKLGSCKLGEKTPGERKQKTGKIVKQGGVSFLFGFATLLK
jgi:hypothetical protein